MYLANLRTSLVSCESLTLRRPEAIVIGDSHSYADWDFAELQRGLGQRLGACALGGLYVDSVPMLVDYVLQSSPGATTLILGLSPRMFWESPSRKEQIDSHVRLIPSLKPNAAPYVRRVLFGEPLPYDLEAEAVRRHTDRLESLDEGAILERLAESQQSIRTLRDWNQRLGESRHMPEADRPVADVCRIVRAHKLRLLVLHMPESPYLEARYPEEVWRAYLAAMRSFDRCAEKVIVEKAVSYGLGNRHYINRELKDTHNYGKWGRPGPLTDDLDFDADHLNPVGAGKFTRAVLAKFPPR